VDNANWKNAMRKTADETFAVLAVGLEAEVEPQTTSSDHSEQTANRRTKSIVSANGRFISLGETYSDRDF
jgi:hypothetical protein